MDEAIGKLCPENLQSANAKGKYKKQIYNELFSEYSSSSSGTKSKASKLARFSSHLGKLKAEFGLGILVLAANLRLRSFMFSDMTKDEFKEMLDTLERDEVFKAGIESISQSIADVESRDIQVTMKNDEE